MTYFKTFAFLCFFALTACSSTLSNHSDANANANANKNTIEQLIETIPPKSSLQTFDIHHNTHYPKDRTAILQKLKEKVAAQKALVVHAFVPLCDNDNQGIVPVSKALGNGQNPKTNLYWGAMYGIKNHFTKSSQWKRIAVQMNVEQPLLERVVFERKTPNGTKVFLIADAYDGSKMRDCVVDYLQSLAGQKTGEVAIEGKKWQAYSEADLLVFNGHDGLMDYTDIPYYLNVHEKEEDIISKDAVMIACYSGSFFRPFLQKAGAYPLVVTTNLMAPEAYVLEHILEQWMALKPAEAIRKSAGIGYNQYQKCGKRGADRLFATGW